VIASALFIRLHSVSIFAAANPKISIRSVTGAEQVGQITSAIWSPRLKTNVGLSLIDADHWDPGTPVSVTFPDGATHSGTVVVLPFA
jgi:glycine cleavage system aminomethyltransferase T